MRNEFVYSETAEISQKENNNIRDGECGSEFWGLIKFSVVIKKKYNET